MTLHISSPDDVLAAIAFALSPSTTDWRHDQELAWLYVVTKPQLSETESGMVTAATEKICTALAHEFAHYASISGYGYSPRTTPWR